MHSTLSSLSASQGWLNRLQPQQEFQADWVFVLQKNKKVCCVPKIHRYQGHSCGGSPSVKWYYNKNLIELQCELNTCRAFFFFFTPSYLVMPAIQLPNLSHRQNKKNKLVKYTAVNVKWIIQELGKDAITLVCLDGNIRISENKCTVTCSHTLAATHSVTNPHRPT